MADKSVIQEFFTALGIRLDAETARRISDAVDKAIRSARSKATRVRTGKSAASMAAAAAEATAALGARAMAFVSALETRRSAEGGDVGDGADAASHGAYALLDTLRHLKAGAGRVAPTALDHVSGISVKRPFGKAATSTANVTARSTVAKDGWAAKVASAAKRVGLPTTGMSPRNARAAVADGDGTTKAAIGEIPQAVADTTVHAKPASTKLGKMANAASRAAATSEAAMPTAGVRAIEAFAGALRWAGPTFGGLESLFRIGNLNEKGQSVLRRYGAYGPSARVQFAERLAHLPIGNLIASGEGDYNSVNLGAKGAYKASTAALTSMTVAQVMEAQRAGKFKAAGRYQLVPGTLGQAAAALHLTGNELFDQSLQDQVLAYLVLRKRRAIGDYLLGKSSDRHAALVGMSREWASFQDPDTGRGHYDAVGKNHASIDARRAGDALFNSRLMIMPTPHATAGRQGARTNHVEIHNDVTIRVTGAHDPHATAQAIGREQRSVMDHVGRNMQGAFQ
ncbi:hypothetical protein [Burkholderia plantarii]|uniref:hypothetical protein n=1 Tax=Burkholderia plantarii TaxID=41899 RepID=UPI000AC21352|nr:hypothetical protein [Burkholderia plantarii]